MPFASREEDFKKVRSQKVKNDVTTNNVAKNNAIANDVNANALTLDITKENGQETVAQKASQSASAWLGNSLKIAEIDISVKKQLQAITSYVFKTLQPVATECRKISDYSKSGVIPPRGFEPLLPD